MKEHREIFQLSREALTLSNFLQDLQLDDDKPTKFTQRLLWLSKGHYTVRPQDHPKKVIGYALIYKMGKSYYEGICLSPEYYYPAIIDQIYEQLFELAKFCYGIQTMTKKGKFHFPIQHSLLQEATI